MATGPNDQVYVVAGRRHGIPRGKDFEQQQVIWRSQDRGASFEAPIPITPEGQSHFDQRVCAVWVDDRMGALNTWARCSTDSGRTWGAETLMSDRTDGAPYKSAQGFKAFFGHYGGAAIDAAGKLHAVWAAGEPGYRTGTVWVNSVDVSPTSRR
jgi:hypothetical protein